MHTIKTLSSSIKVKSADVLKDVALRHRRKFFCKFEEVWYQFPSANEIIIPHIHATKYAKLKNRAIQDNADVIKASMVKPKTTLRTPAAVLLGHFNHGKTSLLDALAHSNIVEQEVAQITQVVRTRSVDLDNDQKLTLVDTPGQEIFFRMRNNGASVADFALLLIACDDGICNQTQESIGILDELNIPVIACLNKIDLVKPQRIQELLQEAREFVALDKCPIVPISVKENTNLDKLKEEITKMVNQVTLSWSNETQHNEQETAKLVKHHRELKLITGVGTIINMWRNREEGSVLHIILQHGEMKVGDSFSSGGWSGYVRKIVHDNTNSISIAHAGYGVQVTISLHADTADPRPLGDKVLIYNASTRELQGKSRELSEFYMRQEQMSMKLSNYAITPEQVKMFRLEELQSRVKNRFIEANNLDIANNRSSLTVQSDNNSLEEVDDNDNDNDATDKDSNDSTVEVVEEITEENARKPVVIKADTDMSLHTIMDAVDEAMEKYDEIIANNNTNTNSEIVSALKQPYQIIHARVGDVTLHDVTIAQAASAPILCYGVSTQKDASKLAQNQKVAMLGFDTIQEIIDIITYKNEEGIQKVEASISGTVPFQRPKRRNTKAD